MHDLPHPIILFAHPRSGSSSLFKTLNLHPALNLLEEPFNENHKNWHPEHKDYRSKIHDSPSLNCQLADIFSTHNGLKLLDYQLPDRLMTEILMKAEYRIIFLRRKNLLQAIVSVLIAHQTQLWKMWEREKPIEMYYEHLRPLDIGDIRSRIAGLKSHLDFCESILEERKDQNVLKLIYEDLYSGDEEQQANQINEVWHFLGLPPANPELAARYLRPKDAKINSGKTYDWIPNSHEINAECGNDETGWLYPNNS